jgi:hypothetical protein
VASKDKQTTAAAKPMNSSATSMAQAVEKYFENGSMPSNIRVQKTQDKQSKEKEEFQRRLNDQQKF